MIKSSNKSMLKSTVRQYDEVEMREQFVMDDMISSGLSDEELEEFRNARRKEEWKKSNVI